MNVYHLDTDYLICFAEPYHDGHARAEADMREWLTLGRRIGASAVAWREFYSGKSKPRPPLEVINTREMLTAGIIRYGTRQAEKAAELFNQVGRLKRLRGDCDIAATAIIANAELATFNLDDFKRFIPFGLRIVGFTPLPRPVARQEYSLVQRKVAL
jgi:predicted nucleic acid-binding protein